MNLHSYCLSLHPYAIIWKYSAIGPKDSAGKKHWTQSQNLEKPWHRAPNDWKYSRRQMDKVGKLSVDCEEFRAFWERKYKGWELVACEKSYQEEMGWYFYLTMQRVC